MATLTANIIAAQERQTAEHYEVLAAKARKAGTHDLAEEFQHLAELALAQATKAEQFQGTVA